MSRSTVEVTMDLKIVETKTKTEDRKKRYSLFADTATIRSERRLHSNLTVSSKLTATLVPAPSPLRLEPERNVVDHTSVHDCVQATRLAGR